MRIFQLLPELSFGDAVGNNVLAIKDLLERHNYVTEIYALKIKTQFLKEKKAALEIDSLPEILPDDVIIYHFAVGNSELRDLVAAVPCKKVLVYHNVTPPDFFRTYAPHVAHVVNYSRQELSGMHELFDLTISDSYYNRTELVDYSFTSPNVVVPILIPYSDYDQEPDQAVLERYTQNSTVSDANGEGDLLIAGNSAVAATLQEPEQAAIEGLNQKSTTSSENSESNGGTADHSTTSNATQSAKTVNILFVGRTAPNKKIERVIEVFWYYNKYHNSKSRLFLIGSRDGFPDYSSALDDRLHPADSWAIGEALCHLLVRLDDIAGIK